MKYIGTSEYQGEGDQEIRASEKDSESVAGFQKLWVWQKAYELMIEIHDICKNLPREKKFRLRDQIERSSSSVCDNIAEGYSAYYYNDKINGFITARKEAGESQNHILASSGKGYIDDEIAKRLVKRYEEVIRGINGYVNYIREKKGTKR